MTPEEKAPAENETLHYCADCHSHCSQTVAAQARIADLEAAARSAEEAGALRERELTGRFYQAAKFAENVMSFMHWDSAMGHRDKFDAVVGLREAIKKYEAGDKS